MAIHGRYVASAYVDMTGQNIPTSWTQLAMTDPNGTDPLERISHISFRNTSTAAINIGTGITGQERIQGILAPNNDMDSLPFKYDPGITPSGGPHIFVQSASGATITSGKLIINFYQTRT